MCPVLFSARRRAALSLPRQRKMQNQVLANMNICSQLNSGENQNRSFPVKSSPPMGPQKLMGLVGRYNPSGRRELP